MEILQCSAIIEEATDRFIELYGDRKEGLGKSIRCGMAWIADAKVVLMVTRDQHKPRATDLRRINRLIDLAEHLKRPILVSLQLLTYIEHGLCLQEIRNRKEFDTTFLKFISHPLPIVTVIDHGILQALDTSLKISDSLLVRGAGSTDFDQTCTKDGLQIIRNVDSDLGLKSSISDMFFQLLTVQKDDLIKRRKNRLRYANS
ncbi:TPA: hypothetical protein EYO77_18060 [Candidatus Poribacteria bacterium]|nr:hypothetical protein [Candidatus Poribacteria bacterium]